MNFERIRQSVNVDRMQSSHTTIIGGAYGLAHDLVRCGLGAATLIDYDHIDSSNIARQDLNEPDIGRPKVEATAESLLRINPQLDIETRLTDFCVLSREGMDELLGQTDLIIDAADSFPVHARVNLEAIRLRKPALWIGMYAGARAGEVVYWRPDARLACYRCICGSRYHAHTQGSAKISSHGGTILDLRLVDAVAGQLAVGLLTVGAENRFGRIIERLSERNLLQIKIDPEYTLGDRDIFREYLGDHPANFSFNTIALPMAQEPDCPDCVTARATEPAV